MTTDIHNKWLAEQVYWVDNGKDDVTYHPTEDGRYPFDPKNPSLGQFQVLAVEDNTANGMQAMAVAPVVDGKVDTTQITIAYAGTNFGDGKDRQTDVNSVILGLNIYTSSIPVGMTSVNTTAQSQVDSALAFADKIQKQYPQADIGTTGHSLGGYLGQLVAIKKQWSATTFNGPDPSNMLTKEEIAWAKANTNILINYRNSEDWIGNFGGDPLGIARVINTYTHYGFAGVATHILDYHGLSTWQFDQYGNLVDKYGLIVDKRNYQTRVDIDADGVADITLNRANTEPRNLFLSSGRISAIGAKDITLVSLIETNQRIWNEFFFFLFSTNEEYYDKLW
ncbi:hypothetical protein [Streptococcus plurextorum]|uniref:hypothetical protein n=1 Tax=Streptococcus plurextorum TaxID=456876 RepID=UPI0004054D74|nr:hypothetical protein [Streptococcus plurextorum]